MTANTLTPIYVKFEVTHYAKPVFINLDDISTFKESDADSFSVYIEMKNGGSYRVKTTLNEFIDIMKEAKLYVRC